MVGNMREYTEVQPHVLREVEHFFSVCKDLKGMATKVLGWKGSEAAGEVIRLSRERFLHCTVTK